MSELTLLPAGHGPDSAFEPDEVPALPRRRQGPGWVVTVISGKPGSGKSVVASNLAAAAARDLHLTTAVLDLALQYGDQALMFDAPPSPSLVDILVNADALTAEFLLECMHVGPHGMRILASPPSPELADLVEVGHLRTIITQLREVFDLVIVDTSSHMGDATIEAIDTADALLVVVTPYLAAVKDTKLLFKLLGDLGVPPRKLRAVLNRVEPGIKMGLDVLEANIKFPISFELPHTPGALVDSATDGIPLVITKPSMEFSQRVAAVAAAVSGLAEADKGHKTVAKRGFLGRARG